MLRLSQFKEHDGGQDGKMPVTPAPRCGKSNLAEIYAVVGSFVNISDHDDHPPAVNKDNTHGNSV